MSELVVTDVHSGSTVRVAPGDAVLVRLPESPTTGYRWQFDVAGALAVSGDTFASGSAAPGAGGERTLRLVASAPGSHSLTAVLRRPWETGVAPQATFTVTVEVR